MKRKETNINQSDHSRKRFLNALSGISLVLFLTLLGCSKPENRLIAEFYNPKQSYKVVAFERIVKDSSTLELSIFGYPDELSDKHIGNIFSAKVDETVEIEDVFADWETNNWSRVILPLGLRDSRKVYDTTLYYQDFSIDYCKCQNQDSSKYQLINDWKENLNLIKAPPPPPPSDWDETEKVVSLFDKSIPKAFIEVALSDDEILFKDNCKGIPFAILLMEKEFSWDKDEVNASYLPFDLWHHFTIDSLLIEEANQKRFTTTISHHGNPTEGTFLIRNNICDLPNYIYSIEYTDSEKLWKKGYYIPVDSIKNYAFINTCKSSLKK